MPKNSSTEVLRRWRALDEALGTCEGVHVASFAKTWKVSTKTVFRDLEAFRALGWETMVKRDIYDGTYCHHGQGHFIFADNFRKGLEDAMSGPRGSDPLSFGQVHRGQVGWLLRLLRKQGVKLSELIDLAREGRLTSHKSAEE